jgi:hypothetical protein
MPDTRVPYRHDLVCPQVGDGLKLRRAAVSVVKKLRGDESAYG